MSRLSQGIILRVREPAAGLCEYCPLPSAIHSAPFRIDHIVARQHGGGEDLDNLALARVHCYRYMNDPEVL